MKREEDSKDRRLSRIKLTRMAKDKFAAFKKVYYKSVTPAFDQLSEKEIEQCMVLLDKINI